MDKWHRDSKVNDLFIRETEAGKAWYFCRRGVKRKIGNVGEWSATAARHRAEELVAEFNSGELFKPVDRAAMSTIPTLRQITAMYEEKLTAEGCKNPEHLTAIVNLSWSKILHRQLDQLTTVEVTEAHNRIALGRGKVAAARAVKALRTLYKYADELDLYAGRNPAKYVKVSGGQSREVFLTAAEQVIFRKVLAEDTHPTNDIEDFFLLSLLTGARRSNICGMRFADIHNDLWTIPPTDSKTKVALEVVLVPEAVAIIETRRADSPWVFPSSGGARPSSCGHLVEPHFWLIEVKRKMAEQGCTKQFTVHDLRRTAATNMVAKGVPLPIIAKMLGHKNVLTTPVYARADIDMVRAALELG